MSAVGASHPELERTEAELVGAVRRGDEQAFGELYGRYGRRIFAYVLRMVGDYGRAEDITQEVFISALRRMRESERPISVKPWLYEIAKNACIDEARRRQRSQEIPLEPEDPAYRLAPGAPSVDACFEHDQRLAALNGAFQGLSEQQHRVLALRELGGHSYEEIATQLGISVAMVESTLLRARRRLGQEYDDIASGRRCEQVHTVIGEGGQRAVDGLGVRERRRFARHIAQCQPCARYAWAAAIEVPGPPMPGLAKKLAGLLPLPAMRWPWGSRSAHGPSASSGARRAAHLLHPSASVGLSPAAAATVAAVVIAGGGAALELLPPGAAQSHNGVTSAQVAAATTPVSAARHSSSTRLGQQVARGGGGQRAGRSRSAGPAAKKAGGAHPAHSSSPGKSPPSSSHPGSPGSPNSQPTVPAVKPPSLPQLPNVPGVPPAKRLVHQLTGPVKKLVKKVLPKLPQLPGLNKLPPLPNQVSPLLEPTKPLLNRLGLP